MGVVYLPTKNNLIKLQNTIKQRKNGQKLLEDKSLILKRKLETYKIEKEDTVAIIEAMKMETEIKSPVAGTISSIDVEFGTDVLTDQAIMTVEE